jgi:flagellar export protein FliJ
MPGFRFPLQQLLDLRQRAEDAARCQLASSQRETSHGCEHLEQLQQACANVSLEAVPSAGKAVQPGLLLNNGLYLARLRLLTTEQEAHVQRLRSREQVDRGVLVEKARHRQALERLKERRAEQHLADQTSRELRRLDETGTMNFVRRRSA